MVDWNVLPADVVGVVASGETIEEYPDGSVLVLGRTSDARALHVVVNEPARDTMVVITRVRAEPAPMGCGVPGQETAMTCVLCRNGTLIAGTADKVLSRDGVTLVVQGVPADICDNCGERYFSEAVTDHLLRLVREAVADGIVVDVRRYVPAA